MCRSTTSMTMAGEFSTTSLTGEFSTTSMTMACEFSTTSMTGEFSTTSVNMAGEFSSTSMAMAGEFRSLRSCIPSVDMTGEHNSLLS